MRENSNLVEYLDFMATIVYTVFAIIVGSQTVCFAAEI